MADPNSTTQPASAPTVTRTWTCVLFDLDGTLTDSAAGITSSLAHTFEAIAASPSRRRPSSSSMSGLRSSTPCRAWPA